MNRSTYGQQAVSRPATLQAQQAGDPRITLLRTAVERHPTFQVADMLDHQRAGAARIAGGDGIEDPFVVVEHAGGWRFPAMGKHDQGHAGHDLVEEGREHGIADGVGELQMEIDRQAQRPAHVLRFVGLPLLPRQRTQACDVGFRQALDRQFDDGRPRCSGGR